MRYKGGLSNTLMEDFKQRKDYKQAAAAEIKDKVLDTWYQYPNYGFLNERYEPVVANAGEDFQNLSRFGEYADPAQRSLPFVVKAFDDLRQVFLERAQRPDFNIPSYFGNLAPVKSYESYEDKYKEYIEEVKTQLSSARTENKLHLLNSIIDNSRVFPITQSGFSLSTNCPASTTGLTLELAEVPYDTDNIKGEILSSSEYGCFVADAYNSGFYIDKNNPWRLIANLSSPRTQEYIREYKETTSIENTLDRFFRRKTQYEDMQSVYSFFRSFGANFNLTTEELISYTVGVRMAEVGIDKGMFSKINQEAQAIFLVYGNNYANDPLKGPASIVGKYCAEHLKKLYEKKARLDSFSTTTVKDLT